MHDTAAVDLLQPAGDGETDQSRHPRIDAAHSLQHGAQVDPVHELLRDEVVAAVAEAVVHGHHVLVVHRRRGARLALESRRHRRVAQQVAAHALEHHEPVEGRLPREMHHAHAPLRDLAEDLEVSQLPRLGHGGSSGRHETYASEVSS